MRWCVRTPMEQTSQKAGRERASERARHINSSEYKLFIYKQIIYQIFILVIEQKLD